MGIMVAWQNFIKFLLYPFIYLEQQRSNLRLHEQTTLVEMMADINGNQMEILQKLQESNTALMSEVVKTSAASSEVIKSWLDGFKSVEIPAAHDFSKPDEEILQALKDEYALENPDTAELAEMTQAILGSFKFEQ